MSADATSAAGSTAPTRPVPAAPPALVPPPDAPPAPAHDDGETLWPQQATVDGVTYVLYAPQFETLDPSRATARCAFSMADAGKSPTFGTFSFDARVDHDGPSGAIVLSGIEVQRCGTSRGSGPVAVSLAAGGEVGIQPALLARLDVACAAVARVGDQLLGQLAGVGLDPLHYGKEVVLVCCLVADPHRHDDLVVAIDRRLAVVALDPAVPTFEDVAVWISEITLGVGFRIAGGSGGQVAAGHCQRVHAAQWIRG
jgi:hypothetical protein